MQQYSDNIPDLWTIRKNGGQNQITINFDVVKQEGFDGDMPIFTFEQITFPPSDIDYGHIVSAMITYKYSNDDMQAIINNYLIDKKNHKQEFDEMQEYRAYAKDTAKLIIQEVQDYIDKNSNNE